MHHLPKTFQFFLCAGLLLATEACLAQSVMAPGDAALHTDRLTPYTARYDLLQQGQTAGTAIVDLSALHVAGQAAFRLTWDLHFPGQTVTDQSFFWQSTLAPYLHLLPTGAGGPGLRVMHYRAEGLRGAQVFPDSTEALHQSFDQLVFEGGIHHLVLAALDLEPEASFELAVGSADQQATMAITVEAAETRSVAGRVFATHRLTVTFAGMSMQVWISPEAPYLIRREVPAIGFVWQLTKVLRDGPW